VIDHRSDNRFPIGTEGQPLQADNLPLTRPFKSQTVIATLKGGHHILIVEFLPGGVVAAVHEQSGTRRLSAIHLVEVSWQARVFIRNFYLLISKRADGERLTETGAALFPGGEAAGIVRGSVQIKLSTAIVVGGTQIGFPCTDRRSSSESGISQGFDPLSRSAPFLIPALTVALLNARGG